MLFVILGLVVVLGIILFVLINIERILINIAKNLDCIRKKLEA